MAGFAAPLSGWFCAPHDITSPYTGSWLDHFYRAGAADLYDGKIKTERHFRDAIAASGSIPELMILGNFIVERHGIIAICRQLKIDTICTEDGFFPHYETLHADPLGFAWESSLARMTFRTVTDDQRRMAQDRRRAWLNFTRCELPTAIHKPFVLWPLQLIEDKVNVWDLNTRDWSDLIIHFRQSLPPEYQLVIRPHPRAKHKDHPKQPLEYLPNTIILRETVDLRCLIEAANAVTGANSTVLMEARLMFHKPVFAYARSWFTNHPELFFPIAFHIAPRELNWLYSLADNASLRTDRLDDYTDWFLCQLLARQLDHNNAQDINLLQSWVHRRTYQSYLNYGEEIFS